MTVDSPNSINQPERSPSAQHQSSQAIGRRWRNFLIAGVATVLSVVVFLGIQGQTSSASLAALAQESTPLEQALGNGKPTLMEFYANWCASCQAMAADMDRLKGQYGDQVNFVMLNVDNSKWLPELLHYRVDGIPQFVFLDQTGESVGTTIGEQPRLIMAENLEALLNYQSLPYAQRMGKMSELETPTKPSTRSDDPRSHGAQVVN